MATLTRRLVVPLDGTPQANVAGPLATGLALALEVPLLLVRVAPDAPTAQVAERQLAGVAHEIERNGVAVERLVPCAASPVEALLSLLRPDDLVIFGLRGRPDFGDVVERVLRDAPCPVALRRAGGRRVLRVRSLGALVDCQASLTAAQTLAARLDVEMSPFSSTDLADPSRLSAVDLVVVDRGRAPLALDPRCEVPLLTVLDSGC